MKSTSRPTNSIDEVSGNRDRVGGYDAQGRLEVEEEHKDWVVEEMLRMEDGGWEDGRMEGGE